MLCVYNRFRWMGFAILACALSLILRAVIGKESGVITAVPVGICGLLAAYYSLLQVYHSFKAWKFKLTGKGEQYGEYLTYLLVDNVVVLFGGMMLLDILLILCGLKSIVAPLATATTGSVLLWGVVMAVKARPYALNFRDIKKASK